MARAVPGPARGSQLVPAGGDGLAAGRALAAVEGVEEALEAIDRRLGARGRRLGACRRRFGANGGLLGPVGRRRIGGMRRESREREGEESGQQGSEAHGRGRYAPAVGVSNRAPGGRDRPAPRDYTATPMTGRDALLHAFDRLFDAAARKLNLVCTPEERAEAKEQFATRFASALEAAQKLEVAELPSGVVDAMEEAIQGLSPAELAGVIASVPLAQQTSEMLRAIAFRQAEQRLLEHLVKQADTRYGGN